MTLTNRSIEDFDAIREKALKLGAKKAEVVDLRRMYCHWTFLRLWEANSECRGICGGAVLPRHRLQCYLRERLPAGYVDIRRTTEVLSCRLTTIGTSLARPVIARAQIEIAKVGFLSFFFFFLGYRTNMEEN